MSLLNNLHSKLYSHNAKDLEKREHFNEYYGKSKDEEGNKSGKEGQDKKSSKEFAESEKKDLETKEESSFISKKAWKAALIFLALVALGLLAFYGYVKFKQASLSLSENHARDPVPLRYLF